MEELKQLVEDFVKYTETWSISENEWYCNLNCIRKKDLTKNDFERAKREDILYCFLYNIQSIKYQLENDLCNYYDEEINFQQANKEIEEKIQKIFKDFKIDRS